MKDSFMYQLTTGQAKEDDIDDAIDQWHTSYVNDPMPLHQFLGMHRDEYAAWVECRLTPQQILDNRSK